MELVIGKTAGFCAGVKNAVDRAEEELQKSKNIFCLGELTHNSVVMNKLISNGLKVIDDIENGENTVIIRAHGVKKEIYEKAKNIGIKLIDLTCPKVLKIHEEAEKYSLNNYYIFLIAESTHPETIGTYSFCGENKYIIEKNEDVENAIYAFKKSNSKDILVIAQTTFSVEKFENIINHIKDSLDKKVNLFINKSICDATRLRQEETIEISKQVDLMIVIGGKNSSNTKKLYEISRKNSKKAILIERKEELYEEELSKYEKIGITAGASTPNESIEEVKNYIIERNSK